MSGQATGWILRNGPHPDLPDRNGTRYGARARGLRSVLIAVGDAANQDGEHAHPGIANVCIGSLYGRRQASKLLAELVADGWLVIEAEGGGAGKATVYRIPGVKAEKDALSARLADQNRALSDSEPRTLEQEPRTSGVLTNGLVTVKNNETLCVASDDNAKRATSFPGEFFLTDGMRSWADQNAPTIDLRTETEQFCDYHRAKGDKAKDWKASWRHWMRNAVKFQRGRTNGNGLSPAQAKEARTHAALERMVARHNGPEPVEVESRER